MRMTLNEAQTRAENRSNFNFINEFFLKNDGESNIVRFLFNDPNDIEVHAVHMIRMTSKGGQSYLIQVDCLGDNCPLCKEAVNHTDEKMPLVSRARDNIYLPLIAAYDVDGSVKPQYKVFTRSTNYYKNTLAPFIKRNDLNNMVEVERQGERSNPRVSYNLYEAKKDFDEKSVTDKTSELYTLATKTIEELKEDFGVKVDDICGRADSLIKTWTKEQVEMFLENPSVYPSLGGNKEEVKEETKEEEVKPRNRRSNHGF